MPPNFCPNCKIKIKSNDTKICPKCGINIGSKSHITSTLPPPPIDLSSHITPSSGKNSVTEENGNKKNWFKTSIVLLIAFVIIAAGLSYVVLGAGFFITPTTGTPTAAATVAPIKELRIGYQPSTHQMAHTTAMDKGWWQQDLAPLGVQNVSDKIFPTGAPEMQAMLAGDLDVAYVGVGPVLSAISTGLDAKIFGSVNTQGSDLVIRSNFDYKSPESLKGLTIATFPVGTIQDTILRNWLAKNNIVVGTGATDVKIIGMGSGDAVTAITAGKVDAVFLPHPSPAVVEAQGKGKIIVHSGEMYPQHTCCVLVVSGKLIREHPEIVSQILKTNEKAVAFNLKNSDEAAAIYATKTGAKIEDVKASLKEWDGDWATDPTPIVASVLDYAKIQYDLGYIKTPLAKDQLFDLTFYKKN